MVFYTRFPTTEFTPLFRLLDDYDTHRSTNSKASSSKPLQKHHFTPKFDVREVNDSYYLDGELPGALQDNIEIEFTDPHTLVIKGKTARVSETQQGSLADLNTEESAPSGASSPKSFHATVEDVNDDGDDTVMSSGENAAHSVSPKVNTLVTKGESSLSKNSTPQFKYWVAERSFGEFSRTFNFLERINQDGVRANLKNGILSVVVPKQPAHAAKKIRVE